MTQQTAGRRTRAALIAVPLIGALALAGCTGGDGNTGDNGDNPDAEGAGSFSVMVAQANDQDDYYAKILDEYSQETGAEIEVIPYPSDAYNTQVTTQLQGGNAADVMILAPGTGQPISVVTLADAGFLEPIDSAASVIPEGTETLYGSDGNAYGQPTGLMPVGFVYNGAAAEEAGISEYPATYDELLDACATARDGGKSFTVLAGAIAFNTGLMSMLVSATRVYDETPDWNEQRAAGDVTFADSDGWRETLEDIVEMNESGCFQDGVAGGTFDNITAGIGGGTALSAAVPGSAATSIGAAAGVDLTVQAFPPASGQSDLLLASANYAWAVNASSDDSAKSAAADFLEWVAGEEQSKTFADLAGMVPITGATTENLLAPYQPVGELLETGAYVGLPNATWPNPAVYDTLGSGVQGLLTGQKTVDDVLADMDAAWG
ncbi:ABC transporter substrate-binding protein [Microbacterium sp. MC2]